MIAYVKDKAAPLACKSALRGGSDIGLPVLTLGARWVWVFSTKTLPLFDRGRETVPIVQ